VWVAQRPIVASTVHGWHHEIDDHSVRGLTAHSFQRFGSTCRGFDFVTQRTQNYFYGRPEIGVVIHHQYAPLAYALQARVAVSRLVFHNTSPHSFGNQPVQWLVGYAALHADYPLPDTRRATLLRLLLVRVYSTRLTRLVRVLLREDLRLS
jgi:hypothetical protein